jgi:hypothetical protein
MTGENGRRVCINGEDQKKAWLTEEPLCVYQEKGAGWGRRERERERERGERERDQVEFPSGGQSISLTCTTLPKDESARCRMAKVKLNVKVTLLPRRMSLQLTRFIFSV